VFFIPLGFNLRQTMGELSRNPASRYSTDFRHAAKKRTFFAEKTVDAKE
jgi:hypothetical protein